MAEERVIDGSTVCLENEGVSSDTEIVEVRIVAWFVQTPTYEKYGGAKPVTEGSAPIMSSTDTARTQHLHCTVQYERKGL